MRRRCSGCGGCSPAAQPEVVHAHGLRAGAVAAFALAGAGWRRRHRCALIVTVHNAPPAAGPAGAVYAVLERIVARRADAVTCVSGDLAARMRRLGAAVAGLAIVPAPPARTPGREAVAAARSDLGGAGRPVVLAAGRLAPQKGFATLLAAAASWQGRDPCPVLALAGAGPLDQMLRAEADAGGLRMRFLGQRGDVPALLAAADVVVVPSRWEGQPLIVQEALRAGRPLVASRTGGIPDLTGETRRSWCRPGTLPRWRRRCWPCWMIPGWRRGSARRRGPGRRRCPARPPPWTPRSPSTSGSPGCPPPSERR